MDCAVAHPYGQLQLDLRGIPPLTQGELALEWLESISEPWGLASLVAVLQVEDEETREVRAERRHWIWHLQNRLSEDGFGMVGGAEVVWLYYESLRCYIAQNDVAAILCAHALCERALAAFLEMRDALDERLARAGLGPVAAAAHAAGLIDEPLLQDLKVINETRKVIAHFRLPFDPHSVHARLIAAHPNANEAFDVESMIKSDAEAALTAATRVIVGLNASWG